MTNKRMIVRFKEYSMRSAPPPLARAGLIAVLIVIVQGLLISWFAWPATELAPRDLPVVVAGPPAAAQAVSGQLNSALPGGFTVTSVADESAADAALRDREAYAAFLISPTGANLHVASAASPTISALLTAAAQQLGGGAQVAVTD